MAKYKTKPCEIEAIQWNGINLEEIKSFVGESLVYSICDTAWEVGKGKNFTPACTSSMQFSKSLRFIVGFLFFYPKLNLAYFLYTTIKEENKYVCL